jgi:hypothetical protein
MSPWPLIATGGVMIEVFLVIGLLWLLVLTVAFAGIVRHLAAMQVAGVGSAAPEGGWLFDTDGPWVPSALPDRAAAALHGHGIPTDDLVVTFFSAHCGSWSAPARWQQC